MKIRFFPTMEGISQSPVETLLFHLSPPLDDENNLTLPTGKITHARTDAEEGTERHLLVVQGLASGQSC